MTAVQYENAREVHPRGKGTISHFGEKNMTVGKGWNEKRVPQTKNRQKKEINKINPCNEAKKAGMVENRQEGGEWPKNGRN